MDEEYEKKREELDKFLEENPEMIQEIKSIAEKPVKTTHRKPRITIILHEIELEKLNNLKRKYHMSRNEVLTRLIQKAKL